MPRQNPTQTHILRMPLHTAPYQPPFTVMNRFFTLILVSTALLLAACGGDAKDPKQQLKKKQEELAALQAQQSDLTVNIAKLQKDIAQLDPKQAQQAKTKLVVINPVAVGPFNHFIDLQGAIEAVNISYVAPRNGMGGYVRQVLVKKGDRVRKGQLVLRLDDALVEKQIAQAQVQLSLAKDIQRRRENLWKESIGTEVELVTARNNVAAAEKGIALLREQQQQSNVYADMSGVVEDVTIRVGEVFTGSPMAGFIKLVNTSDLKVKVNVPENYLGKVKQGTPVVVTLPDAGRTINARVTLAGQIIDPSTRSFYVEVKLPQDASLRPNQVANLQIQDYSASKATTVPVNTLQTDDKGKFVMVAVQEGNKLVARKRPVTIGQLYGDRLEILQGVTMGEQLIVEGYQDVYDGQLVSVN